MRIRLLILLLNVATVVASTQTMENAGVCQDSATTPCSTQPDWKLELDQAQSAWGVCQDEVNRFCEGVQVGEGRIEKCLKDHQAKLSKKCRTAQGLK